MNADLAAAALAKELKPVKLIYISDVPGIMKDPADPSTLIKSVTRTEALDLIEDGHRFRRHDSQNPLRH